MLPIKKATTVLMLGMSLLLQYVTVSAFQPPKQQQSLGIIQQAGSAVATAFILTIVALELEIECTALIPGTWVEYVNKLEEGQGMEDRPDLMKELNLLVNKCKADRLEQVCLDAKLAPDLWKKYQNMLDNEQKLQDRPELIFRLDNELSQRAGQVLKENTSVCPAATWTNYEEKAGDDDLIERPELLEALAEGLGYYDLVGACSACLLKDAGIIAKVEGDAREDATTIS